MIGYIISYADRVNIGFAAITASKDLGMSPSVFGFGAGLFFLAYLIFETPSNYLMEKVGARRWLGRIMVCCGLLLGLDGVLGFKGWQWLYILEALPALLVGMIIWFWLTDSPAEAKWLKPEERDWIQRTLERERAQHPEKTDKVNLLQSMRLLADPRVIVLSLVFFGTGVPSYGLALWLPRIVKSFGLTNIQTGFLSAIPFVCGTVAMLWWARHSDHTRERTWHTASAAMVAAIGMAACFWISSPAWTLVALSVSAIGTFGLKGPFLSGISESFSDKTAAVGIAMVVSIGYLSGFAAPWMIGAIRQATGGFPPAWRSFCNHGRPPPPTTSDRRPPGRDAAARQM
jgi:sugar phosphate permease